MNLENEWFDLTKNYSVSDKVKKTIFDELYKKYSEKHRFYHNLNHITELLNFVNQFNHKINDIESVKFSIWFHDVIYNPFLKDNEEKSSNYAINQLKTLDVNNQKIDKISRLIILTKNHGSFFSDFDENIFLDSDLSILGSNSEIYKKYSEKIRKEYFFVPKIIYKKGRVNVLNHFLTMPKIYKTQEAQNLYEEQARINLKNEILDLTK